MQYRVPQNIDQEDKILGPLTFVQFIYVLIGGALLLVLFAVLNNIWLFLLIGVPILVLTVLFSLVKVQDQPFSRFFIALLIYLRQPKHRIWQDLDNPVDSQGLGASFQHDLSHDEPAPTQPTPSPEPTEKKIIPISHTDTATPIDTTPTAAPPATDTLPPLPEKPVRRLTVAVEKGGS